MEYKDKDFGIDALKLIGKALYGEQWQTNLSNDLGLSDPRRVRYWLSGGRKIPTGIWNDLAKLLEQRKNLIEDLLKKIAEREHLEKEKEKKESI
ncbi:hypothetical protein [Gallibacterium sp. AGMB14963]|uniref:hypothetical protein n=1 Tax=Gallibacterium faecale TaxID=3019086 RepID=UPI0022F14826|nr:hypothetical protein [Gallibacterium sp. AGMB14963]MDA3979055.1 hypothetical protein [Gallibacterium sp. AGMB14963]